MSLMKTQLLLRYSHSDLYSVLCGCVWGYTDFILVSFFAITLFCSQRSVSCFLLLCTPFCIDCTLILSIYSYSILLPKYFKARVSIFQTCVIISFNVRNKLCIWLFIQVDYRVQHDFLYNAFDILKLFKNTLYLERLLLNI